MGESMPLPDTPFTTLLGRGKLRPIPLSCMVDMLVTSDTDLDTDTEDCTTTVSTPLPPLSQPSTVDSPTDSPPTDTDSTVLDTDTDSETDTDSTDTDTPSPPPLPSNPSRRGKLLLNPRLMPTTDIDHMEDMDTDTDMEDTDTDTDMVIVLDTMVDMVTMDTLDTMDMDGASKKFEPKVSTNICSKLLNHRMHLNSSC